MDKNWNLSKVFSSLDEATRYLEKVSDACKDFAQKYKGECAQLSVNELAQCVKQYSGLKQRLCRVDSYAYLVYSTNLLDAKISDWYQNVTQQVSVNEFQVSFLIKEFETRNDWDWKLLAQKLSKGDIAFLQKRQRLKSHCIASEDVRKLFNEQDCVHKYWMQAYEILSASEQFEIDDIPYTRAEIVKFLKGSDTTLRRKAGLALSNAHAKHGQLYATIYNAMLQQRLISYKWHNYDYPAHAANLENDIDARDLDNLVNTVMCNAPEISHRYYKIKARLFDVPQISYWDRDAIPDVFHNIQKLDYTIEEAREIILETFCHFSQEFADIAAQFFDNNWIDYFPCKGKTTLNYCIEMPTGINPFICLNFTGNVGSVTTMAHEIGHGIHEYLSKQQGELGREKSIAQAEIASIFGETLVFHGLLQKARTPEEKVSLLSQRIGEMILSSFRQISLHQFEEFAHEQRQKGHISAADLSKAFERFVSYPLGEAIDMTTAGDSWSSIPHFFLNTPFYVYSYCFSLCVANSLYDVYQSKKVSNFEEKYMTMLKNGGVENYREALAHFGIDATNPQFWQGGLNLIKHYVDELEKLVREHFSNT